LKVLGLISFIFIKKIKIILLELIKLLVPIYNQYLKLKSVNTIINYQLYPKRLRWN